MLINKTGLFMGIVMLTAGCARQAPLASPENFASETTESPHRATQAMIMPSSGLDDLQPQINFDPAMVKAAAEVVAKNCPMTLKLGVTLTGDFTHQAPAQLKAAMDMMMKQGKLINAFDAASAPAVITTLALADDLKEHGEIKGELYLTCEKPTVPATTETKTATTK